MGLTAVFRLAATYEKNLSPGHGIRPIFGINLCYDPSGINKLPWRCWRHIRRNKIITMALKVASPLFVDTQVTTTVLMSVSGNGVGMGKIYNGVL